MGLVAIYACTMLACCALFLKRTPAPAAFRRTLLIIHWASLLLLITDALLAAVFKTSLRTSWADRIPALLFFTSAPLLFVLYRKQLSRAARIYWGVFFVYPFIAALLFIGEKIFFILVAMPLIITLVLPETIYNGPDYDVREVLTVMGPKQFVLIEKGILTEAEAGFCSDPERAGYHYNDLEIRGTDRNGNTNVFLRSARDTVTLSFFRRGGR